MPTVIGGYTGPHRGRRRLLRQLPPRPRPGDDPGAGRPRFRQLPACRSAAGRPGHDDLLSQGLALSGGVSRSSGRRRRSPRSCREQGGGRQLHVAETEKYAHVTYFFNGGREQEWEGEERILVDSPRDVATYDQKPEMSARAAADAFTGAWSEDGFRFGIINFANSDMVGHTGDIPAAVRAVTTVDSCLGDVVDAVHAQGRRLYRSPPTTATPTTCWNPTARRTPPTRSTRCR